MGARHHSVPSEGNMFESIDPRRHVLRIGKLRVRNMVLADAARAIESKHVSGHAAMDDAFATHT